MFELIFNLWDNFALLDEKQRVHCCVSISNVVSFRIEGVRGKIGADEGLSRYQHWLGLR